MATNLWLLASGVMVLALAVFHSLLGEIFIVRRLLRRENLPHLFGGDSFTKATIRYAWHLLTIVCVALAALLFFIATRPLTSDARLEVRMIAAFLVFAGGWGLVSTRARHLSWVVLLLAGGSAWLGSGAPM